MRVYISADIEGVTGIVTWGQAGSPNQGLHDWPFARRMMTHDVNAAIRGARAAGAHTICVKDSHNTGKNLLIDELEDGVELISGAGSGRDGMMEGVDDNFDCALLIGYHAMAGTHLGIMEHTISGMVHRLRINGEPAGEIRMSAATAGQYGVPTVMISSDEAGCAEAGHLIPSIEQAVVKTGLGRYMGRLKHPSITGTLIERNAEQAVAKAKSMIPLVIEGPVSIELEHNRTEESDTAELTPGWHRIDGFTIGATCPDWASAHLAIRRAMAAAGQGASNNT